VSFAFACGPKVIAERGDAVLGAGERHHDGAGDGAAFPDVDLEPVEVVDHVRAVGVGEAAGHAVAQDLQERDLAVAGLRHGLGREADLGELHLGGVGGGLAAQAGAP